MSDEKQLELGKAQTEKPREKWKNKFDFIFGVAGGSIGLGNVWRFPYLCYKNGGGAFLIPYVIFLVGVAVPLFFMEASLGQYTSAGVIKAWAMFPLMKGIGFACLVICFNIHTYYMTVLCWGVRYLAVCFQRVLPWNSCGNDWNTPNCFVFGENVNSSANVSAYYKSSNVSGYSATPGYEATTATDRNVSVSTNAASAEVKVSSVVEYWERSVLGLSEGLHDIGTIKPDLLICLIVCWLIVYFCIWKGIQWTAKIVYFTASFPLFMLIILLVRGVTLDGASDGIAYYLKPNITKLLGPQVWADAATQVFFSYSVGSGIMVAMGSYNVFNHNVYRDTVVFAFLNSGTSFIAGFSVFSVLGFMAKEQNTTIDTVAESGPGLVFITYPRAIALMPLPQLWAVLFFLMVFLLGLDSEFIGQESIIAALADLRPRWFSGPKRREISVAVVCLVQFLLELLMITNGGAYVFNMYDNYAGAGWSLFFIGTCECLTVAWLYGHGKFWDNVCNMLGFRPFPWIKYAWACVTPIILTVTLVYSLAKYEPLTYNIVYTYPVWAQAICWCMSLSAVMCIPCYAIYRLCVARGSLKMRWEEVRRVPTVVEVKLKIQEMQDLGDDMCVPLNAD